MLRRDIKGIIGGGGLAAVGLFAVWYGQTHYQFGGVHNMGPGFLPVSLGGVLALLGMCIAIPAWFRSGEPISTEWGSAFSSSSASRCLADCWPRAAWWWPPW
ncbi:hypothetical protein MBH78_21975 [Oceanimonas sp. NS1]|nr:hypothetical protein [Oceanimonas sp. NS1]